MVLSLCLTFSLYLSVKPLLLLFFLLLPFIHEAHVTLPLLFLLSIQSQQLEDKFLPLPFFVSTEIPIFPFDSPEA